jgi:hypothetical protein
VVRSIAGLGTLAFRPGQHADLSHQDLELIRWLARLHNNIVNVRPGRDGDRGS